MKKFVFSLEKVRRYKRLLREQKQAMLLKANQAYLAEKQELERLQLQLVQRKNNLLSGRLSPAILAHRASSIEFLTALVTAQEEKTREALDHVRECRRLLVKADQEQQVLEKLKERKRQEYNYLLELEMQKELDEVATSAFVRRG